MEWVRDQKQFIPMATSILTPDILAHLCSHLPTVHHLATLCAVNRATSAYLLGSGGQHWMDAARMVCGEDFCGDYGGRDVAKITMCPWLSMRRSIDLGYRSSSVQEVFSCSRGTCDVLVLDDSGKLVVVSIKIGDGGGYSRDSIESNYLISAALEDPHRLKTKDLRRFLLRSWAAWFDNDNHRVHGVFRVHSGLFAALTRDSILFVSPRRRRILHTLPNVRVDYGRGAQCTCFCSPGEIWIVDEDGILLYSTS